MRRGAAGQAEPLAQLFSLPRFGGEGSNDSPLSPCTQGERGKVCLGILAPSPTAPLPRSGGEGSKGKCFAQNETLSGLAS